MQCVFMVCLNKPKTRNSLILDGTKSLMIVLYVGVLYTPVIWHQNVQHTFTTEKRDISSSWNVFSLSLSLSLSLSHTQLDIHASYVTCTYLDNKALSNSTRYFIVNLLLISLIFIENKCFSDANWNLKKEGKKGCQKAGSNGSNRVKINHTHNHLRHQT